MDTAQTPIIQPDIDPANPWPSRLPPASLTLLFGGPAAGKTALCAALAAAFSDLNDLADVPAQGPTRFPTLLLPDPAAAHDPLLLRLKAATTPDAAPYLKLLHLTPPPPQHAAHRSNYLASTAPFHTKLRAALSNLPSHTTPLSPALLRPSLSSASSAPSALSEFHSPPPLLLLIDPLEAHAGDRLRKLNVHRLTAIVPELAAIAREHNLAILATIQLAADDPRSAAPLLRACPAAASALFVTRDSLDPERRLLISLRSPAPDPPITLPFSIRRGLARWDNSGSDDAFLPTDPFSPAAVNRALPHAARWLRTNLAKGPRKARDLILAAAENGIPTRTLYNARQRLGIHTRREGFGPGSETTWSIAS